MASRPDYVFTRDYLDNNRINLQHYIWTALYGYCLHPELPISSADLTIADVGTGTAIWLTDVAARLPPTTRLEGLDVSFHAAPPLEYLASNITLRNWDVKGDVPAELVERYDVVHIRNFVFVLCDDDIPKVLSNLMKLLKPGGHIQWGEPDMLSWQIKTMREGLETSALMQLMKLSQPQDPRLSPTWVPKLPEQFKEAGLLVVECDVRDAPPALAMAMHECALQIHEQVARMTKNEEVAQGLKDLMPQVLDETRQGACWTFTRWTVVGKKPPNQQ
ncbi:S-adenosyl-L-methionine-dependent methyltransferase [Hypoxylon sp. NC1633]|nr:S-adenosyl-L-methionine-dependent methyltransferase [Hypoxylon sp. NC1633]